VPAERPGRGRRPVPETREAARARRAAIDDPEVVVEAAARLLESRPRSIAEVRRHLTGAGYRGDLVEEALARLVHLGYLDDAEFARSWVASRDRAHPRGERALRSELARMGIPRDVVDVALGEREVPMADLAHTGGTVPAESADESAAAHLLARRRAGLERVADPRIRRQRAYALLARNGFDPDTAARVAERFIRGAEPD
jgi:regulatory protein